MLLSTAGPKCCTVILEQTSQITEPRSTKPRKARYDCSTMKLIVTTSFQVHFTINKIYHREGGEGGSEPVITDHVASPFL